MGFLDLFRRKPAETRASGTGYTSAIMAARGAFIAGTSTAAELSAAVQTAVTLWEAGLSLADVRGTDLLNRRSLALVARSLALRGEAVLLIRDRLIPALDWDLSTRDGIPRAYRLGIPEIGGGRSETVLAGEVLHFRIGCAPATPWAGSSPLSRAPLSAALLTEIETALRDVYRDAPIGSQIIPLPEGSAEDMDNLRSAFRGRRGSSLVIEGVAQATAAGMNPQIGQTPNQLSPQLDHTLADKLLTDARGAIYATFGILPGLHYAATTGPMVREAQRHLAQLVLQPIANLIAEETDTIGGLIEAYIAAWPGLPRKLAPSTQAHYRRYLKRVEAAWGGLRAEDLRPKHVQALMEKIGAEKPASANNILDALKAMCNWARGPRDLLQHDPTHGVVKFKGGEGFKPWTPSQLKWADENLTGALRRGYFLGRYTGQRASDVIRLGWNDVDGDVIPLRQKKTGATPYCPILPELEAEMRTWEKRPGPFLLQETGRNAGKPFTTNQLWKVFDRARAAHPEIEGAVWHGLRANACIRHRMDGKTALQISDMVGLSVEMVERYCRHTDRKAVAEATAREHRERENGENVKPLKNLQQRGK